jgi:glucosamine kinase
MVVVAYSALGTTEWSIIESTGKVAAFTTEELNPILVDNYTVVRALITHFPKAIDPRNITQVFFYGVGCSTQQHQQRIVFCLESFFEEATIIVDTDLAGAAKGVFNNTPGLIAILGTSSSTCVYNGSTIIAKSISLNIHIGNEGGSISIGTQIAKSYYYGSMPNDLMDRFKEETGITQEDLFNSLNSSESPALFLSSFVDFASAHKDHPFVLQQVKNSFCQFIDLHLVPLSRKTGIKNIGIVGSIGFLFNDILQNEISTHKLQVQTEIQSPIQGLTEYHRAKL